LRVKRRMSDIPILFPPDKKIAAQQIADALAAARFTGRLTPLGDASGEAVLEPARGAGSAIFIWSRALAASADLEGWLRPLRQLPNIIEVSTDGIAPLGGDESRVVLLSGWRGQPFHLGWQRILTDLEAKGTLHRSTAAPPTSVPESKAPAAAAQPGVTVQPHASQPQRRAASRFAIPAIAAAALLGIVGAASWMGEGRSPSREPVVEPGAASAPPPAASKPPLQPAPQSALEDLPPESAEVASSPAPDGEASVPSQSPSKASIRNASRIPAVSPAPAKPRAAAPVPPVVKRYSKKRSKVMRKFCERSGRHTLECRIFTRSTAAARR